MIMPQGQQLLLPANPVFVWSTLVGALLLSMLPLGRVPWMPDFLALVLLFWCVHQPARVGIGTAFVFGLIIDVHQTALLGQHAWSYTTLAFFAALVHRRILWFRVPSQTMQLFPLFAGAFALELLIRLVSNGGWPGWLILLKPVLTTALWPLVNIFLLAPQRRAPNPDATRPL
ncbi:MAG: rod shape-determining protein MreD [Pseudomonadota bacterium]